MKTNMYFGAPSRLFSDARQSRKNPSKAEEMLWERLRNKQTGFKFRRQHPLSNYIVDFYCHALQYVLIVVETINALDDKDKDSSLEEKGLFVQRFTNKEVINDIESVMEQIHDSISYLRQKRLA